MYQSSSVSDPSFKTSISFDFARIVGIIKSILILGIIFVARVGLIIIYYAIRNPILLLLRLVLSMLGYKSVLKSDSPKGIGRGVVYLIWNVVKLASIMLVFPPSVGISI
ncbi:MAG: hypothetical protein IH840_02860 [Candidatus Heimdallarchaeota archaeon]|nr:hypothetical protein [Candidatus Heimdallarchaeota archaeon]